jgi:hypothetical protein
MARYLTRNVVLDTAKAQRSWPSSVFPEALHLSSKGRYWLERFARYEPEGDAIFLHPEQAAQWLLYHEYELPADLALCETAARRHLKAVGVYSTAPNWDRPCD